MSRIKACNSCGRETLEDLIDLGAQAVCHHFLKEPDEEEERHHLVMGCCTSCGAVQLTGRVPFDAMIPRYDWLTCTEPEAHLDDLVAAISRLDGINENAVIGGLSFKDDTTLDRFNKLGFTNTWRVDPKDELGMTDPNSGIETIQDRWTQCNVDGLIARHGLCDVFLARHILEHAYDMRRFIAVCKKMVKPGGYLVFEVPDCQRAFEKLDYTTIWDQHTVYFTGETFQHCFGHNGLSLVRFEKITYSIEDSYVGIARAGETNEALPMPEAALARELGRARTFANQYPVRKNKFREYLKDYRNGGKKAALFGAGHMSSTFLNVFGLKDQFEFVVDDNPNMRGLYMPGSRLPIVESKTMYDENIKLCLLTLSATSEAKVIENNRRFLEKGGAFLSIFPGSRWAVEV